MGTTSNFIKLRSSKTPKTGEWNIDYVSALVKAKKEGKYIITVWSNGDMCGYCVNAEKCMMTSTFKTWMSKTGAYFVFQYSGDKDKGKTVHDWVYKGTGISKYPGFRITLYDAKGNIVDDHSVEGNTLRASKTGETGAKNMVANLSKLMTGKTTPEPVPESDDKPTPSVDYKVRLNEKLTVKKINAILDAIDKNEGYCPCQAKGKGTKCHCDDFVKTKKIGEPCICKIYVKQKK